MVGNLGVFGSWGVLLLLRHLNMVVEKQVARMMGGVGVREKMVLKDLSYGHEVRG